jgi:hypothetical protein
MRLHASFSKPKYGAGCFADLPATIHYLLTGTPSPGIPLDGLAQRYDSVIVLFLDSFGWRFFERFQDHPLLAEISRHGVVNQLTSQFPSTTAAHVTCLHTGQPVGQHGIFEWQYYDPAVDMIIAPLLFSPAGTPQRELLASYNIQANLLFPKQNFYRELSSQGIKAHIFQEKSYAHSSYSRAMLEGANVVPYCTLPEALVNLVDLLAQQKHSASYYLLYFDKIDSICHDYGPNSAQVEAEIEAALTIINQLFFKKLVGALPNTLLVITADHGQTTIDPNSTVYLNLESRFKDLERTFKTNRRNDLLVPAGSCRDMFLYLKEDQLELAQILLSRHLAGVAEVYQTADLIEAGLFGPTPVSASFQSRVGNLVILPFPGQSVWWFEKDKFWVKQRGHHGGLCPEEVEIPLLLYPL